MKKNVIIFGNGGHFREIYSLMLSDHKNQEIKKFKFIGIIDKKKRSGLDNFSRLLFIDENKIKYKKNLYLLVAIGSPEIRNKIIKKYINYNFVSYTHSSSIISPNVKIGKGVIIGPNNIFTSNAIINDYNQFNSQCVISHDCQIGLNNQFSSAVKIMGKCFIGNNNFFGVDSKMIDNTKVLNNNIIGANTTITKKFSSNNTIIGTPGKTK